MGLRGLRWRLHDRRQSGAGQRERRRQGPAGQSGEGGEYLISITRGRQRHRQVKDPGRLMRLIRSEIYSTESYIPTFGVELISKAIRVSALSISLHLVTEVQQIDLSRDTSTFI